MKQYKEKYVVPKRFCISKDQYGLHMISLVFLAPAQVLMYDMYMELRISTIMYKKGKYSTVLCFCNSRT